MPPHELVQRMLVRRSMVAQVAGCRAHALSSMVDRPVSPVPVAPAEAATGPRERSRVTKSVFFMSRDSLL